jgi:hypothetical protein
MTTPSLLTDEETQDLISQTRKWLGYDGIYHLRKIKRLHGTLDATWMELGEADNIEQYIPRCVLTQEAKYLRGFISTIEFCKDWSDDDFNKQWVWLLEESIKERK